MNLQIAENSEHTENASDIVARTSAAALSATLDYEVAPQTGEALPLLWHWIFFRPTVPQHLIAEDGHPQKGGFLPDLGLPRRMWAGGRLRFISPLIVGNEITRESTILNISEKHGRSGKLGFVTVSHQIRCAGTLAIDEEQDIVYREPPVPGAAAPAPTAPPDNAQWKREVVPDEVLMFRYSALTFNAHRIHYDKPYVTQTEGYPNLVVHGPLIATLLMDLVRRHRPDAAVLDFSFKAMRPSFMGNTLYLCGSPSPDGKSVELWSHDHEGWQTMSARAVLA
ncbi:FAS1-like dehydratase domain-containing protein [Paraburkholderia silvatlantica]|uniref:3-methylfumaryl-CoA hydratase n=1 Tax=Paraburkholderia silvatlantica TaxID=321895 RepID=A0A2U1A123_9BURK|nr:MaoC family dehydratase N-terminal domain-containing protein [Paraburkholderia silvatlantica]MBB2926450.1 3-methylfumaryl-CoA hydratase [Paraburkholderia silvatlantica]PVY25045.1 3-methylfumaryl-CoA hydratase [Paraburkholderia silvatlantica]PXW30129.1 3-methylfumaryl-CoA hydratase [Paraburkholderia silvatlantica]PYE16699.1 3-methylfumaryl-CoA hydratase [Paraburkholderia silvatlantica]